MAGGERQNRRALGCDGDHCRALHLAEQQRKVLTFRPVRALPVTVREPRISLWQGDITRLKADDIVNAANSALLGCCPLPRLHRQPDPELNHTPFYNIVQGKCLFVAPGFGGRIKEIRAPLGISQQKYADLLGVGRCVVSVWEIEQHRPSRKNYLKIMESRASIGRSPRQ